MKFPVDSAPLYNSRIINTYVKYVRKCYPHININELFKCANMEPYEVADQNHWFTQEQINLFHEKMEEMTGTTDIARQAGRYATSPEASGVMRQYVLGMIDPIEVYELVSKVAPQFSRSAKYESKKINSETVEIIVTPNEGTHEQPFQCQNRIGQFESIALVFNSTLPRIDHTECIFKGGTSCRYTISWDRNLSLFLKRARNIAALLLAIVSAIWVAFFSVHDFVHYLPILIIALFLIILVSDHQIKKELRNSALNLQHSRDDLIKQMEINYNNSQMVQEIGITINKYMNLEEILENVMNVLEKRLGYDRCLMLFANEARTHLVFKAGFGYNDEQLDMIRTTEFNLTNPESKGVFVRAFREQKPYLINDINTITEKLSQKSMQFAKKLGSQSFICCPILSDKKAIGILTVDNFITKKNLVKSDLSLLRGIASVIGVSIRNAELYEQRDRQLKSVLKALAASIDARDPYTSGHSEKVTEYVFGICRELNVPADYAEIVGIAASLHDYGKIGISDALLKKEGRLTPEEFEIIKTHSVKTRTILEQINFHGAYSLIPEIAEAHHEKLDGSGYPRGLKGHEIPMGSRIIAVADFFEAITAKRVYRGPIPVPEAIEMLRNESEVHFSQDIVEAFINFYQTKYNYSG